MLPFPMYLKRRAYNPDLRSIGILAISDIVTMPVFKWLEKCAEEKIIDTNHPMAYGLVNPVKNIHAGGPKIIYVGKNAEALTVLQNSSDSLDGSPSWVISDFGSGKVMVFTTHPEIVDSDQHPDLIDTGLENYYQGKKIICNSIYYTSMKNEKIINFKNFLNVKSVLKVINEEETDKDEIINKKIIDVLIEKIDKNVNLVNNLLNKTNQSINTIKKTAYENNIDVENNSIYFLGYLWTYLLGYRLKLNLEYLTYIKNTILKIGHIYNYFENNNEFVDELNLIKNITDEQLDEIYEILFDSLDDAEKYQKNLDKYNHNSLFSSLYDNKLQRFIKNHAKNAGQGITFYSKIFFNLLKFLRKSWYNFESTNIK